MPDKLNNAAVDMPALDAATVVLLRHSDASGIELLLLCRGNSHTVMNNAYVFPGGKLDPEDESTTRTNALDLPQPAQQMLDEPDLSAARAAAIFVAAVRETREETSVEISASALIPLSRWITPTTPSMMRKRFDARFFVTRMPADQTAVHDGEEATDSTWLSPHDALRSYQRGEITLAPPQIMTLIGLLPYKNVDSALQAIAQTKPGKVQPHVEKHGENVRILAYPGDPSHPIGNRAIPGPSRLVWQDDHFAPDGGFDALLA